MASAALRTFSSAASNESLASARTSAEGDPRMTRPPGPPHGLPLQGNRHFSGDILQAGTAYCYGDVEGHLVSAFHEKADYIYGLGWRIQFGVKWSDIPCSFGRKERLETRACPPRVTLLHLPANQRLSRAGRVNPCWTALGIRLCCGWNASARNSLTWHSVPKPHGATLADQ